MTQALFIVINSFNLALIRGWTKEVGSRAELRGTLVLAKAIVITI